VLNARDSLAHDADRPRRLDEVEPENLTGFGENSRPVATTANCAGWVAGIRAGSRRKEWDRTSAVGPGSETLDRATVPGDATAAMQSSCQ
jgi:hypothetical protein